MVFVFEFIIAGACSSAPNEKDKILVSVFCPSVIIIIQSAIVPFSEVIE